MCVYPSFRPAWGFRQEISGIDVDGVGHVVILRVESMVPYIQLVI